MGTSDSLPHSRLGEQGVSVDRREFLRQATGLLGTLSLWGLAMPASAASVEGTFGNETVDIGLYGGVGRSDHELLAMVEVPIRWEELVDPLLGSAWRAWLRSDVEIRWAATRPSYVTDVLVAVPPKRMPPGARAIRLPMNVLLPLRVGGGEVITLVVPSPLVQIGWCEDGA